MTELEYKVLISKSEYTSILEKLKFEYNVRSNIQINYYFDTSSFDLDKNEITFRIRQKNNTLTAQVKIPVEREGLLSIKTELDKPVQILPLSIDLNKSSWQGYLACEGLLLLQGMLVTERASYNVRPGIKIDLDKNSYLGITDYEMEVEFEPELKEETLAILGGYIDYNDIKPQGGKRDRFFKKLKGMGRYLLD